MKINFPNHYRPEKADIDKAYENAIFILDTNTLLDLYRINPEVTEKALKTIKKHRDKIFIARHTDEEYHRHHYDISAEMCLTVKEVVTHLSVDPFRAKLEEIIKKSSKFNCTFPLDLQKRYLIKLETTINEIKNELSSLQGHFKKNFETHTLQHEISGLFQDRVLPGLNEAEIDDIVKSKGPERYNKKTPPGYMDAGKATDKDDNNTYGDLIIWFEILEFVKKNPTDIFFISRDVKEDWLSQVGDMVIGPRMELLVEFRKVAPHNIFHIITLTDFLEKFGKGEDFSKDELGSIPTSSFVQMSPFGFMDDYKHIPKDQRHSLEDQYDDGSEGSFSSTGVRRKRIRRSLHTDSPPLHSSEDSLQD